MPSIRAIKLTIGGPESTPGTPVARSHVIPIRGVPDLDEQVQTQEDPAIVGAFMSTGEYAMAKNVSGGIPLAIRPVAGIGKILKSLLGTESTPVQIGAGIRIRYTGAQPSCKIIADTGTDTLVSQIGALGSEANDSNFGTAGSIDLTNTSFDTIGELVAAIDAYTDYECQKLFGADACLSNLIITKTGQAANGWIYLFFTSATSGVYERHFTPEMTETERPTYSVQKDGFQDNFLYPGVVADTLRISGKLKAIVDADVSLLGFTEAIGQSASSLSLENVDPMAFWSGSTAIGGKNYPFIRDFSLEIKNGHNEDGFGQGSISRQYHQKGDFEVTGDLTLRLNSDAYALRASIAANSLVAISLYLKGKEIAAGSGIYELLIIEAPFCRIRTFAFVENGTQIDAKLTFGAKNPKGTKYDGPFTVYMLSADSAAY